jgi:hypothetical protein
MQWWLYSSRVGLIERSKREMLECSKKNALHKNIDDCMSFFRSSLSFSSIWQNIVLRFFFYLFHLARRRRQKESRYSIQCLDNDVMSLCICVPFPGNVDVVPPTHSFNHLSIHMLSYPFFLLPLPVYQFACSNLIVSCLIKKERRKRKENRRW